MPLLITTLANYDLDMLARIARRWVLPINQQNEGTAQEDLVTGMLRTGAFASTYSSLDEATCMAWNALVQKGGKVPWVEFSRKFGVIRDFGPASREREEPDLHPASASEALWYAGLVGRAFMQVGLDPKEYIYIPDELLEFVKEPDNKVEKPPVRPSVNQTPKYVDRADLFFTDRLTDALAALRMQRDIPDSIWDTWRLPKSFAHRLLQTAGIVDDSLQPIPEGVKDFLSASRVQVHARLFQAWLDSREINELRMLPGLVFEGTWQNDPTGPRELLTRLLSSLDTGTWWSISSLLSIIKETSPDFQRPAGDYDSWYIREGDTTNYLSGFQNWDRVEGNLLSSLLSGPLHWFGIVNLARVAAQGKHTAFQIIEEMRPLLSGSLPSMTEVENREIKIKDTRNFAVPNFSPRVLRYQVARFCNLAGVHPKGSLYHLTTTSLKKAENQGLHLVQLLQLLDKENAAEIPMSLRRLGERWSLYGQETTIAKELLLRFTREESCAEFIQLAKDRFTLEVLNSNCILFSAKQQEGIIKLLNELGILADIGSDV